MSLFALRREYQRSFDRVFEDFSVQSRAQTELSSKKVGRYRHRSVFSLNYARERYVQRKTQKTIKPRVAGGCEFIHHDVKAWACFLDSKRKV